MSAEPTYRIGDVAEEVGVTVRTIRYYEELGLLEPAESRSKGSHRLYDDADIARLRELVRLRNLLGLSLDELLALSDDVRAQEVRPDRWQSALDDDERRRILEQAISMRERQLELVRSRQQTLAEFESELSEKADELRR